MRTSIASSASFKGISKWSVAIAAAALASALTATGYQVVSGGTTWDAPTPIAAGASPTPTAGTNGTTWD